MRRRGADEELVLRFYDANVLHGNLECKVSEHNLV